MDIKLTFLIRGKRWSKISLVLRLNFKGILST